MTSAALSNSRRGAISGGRREEVAMNDELARKGRVVYRWPCKLWND
jgi:hypothetical protein